MTEAPNPDKIIAGESPLEALDAIETALGTSPDNAALLIEKGKLLWRMSRRGEAMSAYEQAAAIDPDGPAKLLIEHTNAIMDFFNPDLLNP